MDIRFKLTIMNFLEFAVWGAYLTSMGTYLSSIGLAEKIGNFYAMQGIVSIFMPRGCWVLIIYYQRYLLLLRVIMDILRERMCIME